MENQYGNVLAMGEFVVSYLQFEIFNSTKGGETALHGIILGDEALLCITNHSQMD